MADAGIYIHIPFCISRCSYCAFATDVVKSSDSFDEYVSALVAEIDGFSAAESFVDTVYFGGGTPSLLSPLQLDKILIALNRKFSIRSDAEITMEMNPGGISHETIGDFLSLGVNRASFGLQTFDDMELKRLGRRHTAAEARDTFRFLREAGFTNVNFDLIAGLPRQTHADWKRNLREALALDPEHISLYLLEVHENTPLAEQIKTGRQPMPDDDVAAEMFYTMLEYLAAAGFGQYEISNFCKPGFESRHNSKYWLLEPVLGFGTSAHSFDGAARYANERDTATYVSMIGQKGNAEVIREEVDIASEFIFLGLRLSCGIDLSNYRARFGSDIEADYRDDLSRLGDAELIEIEHGTLRLTSKGMLLSNDVFSVFV